MKSFVNRALAAGGVQSQIARNSTFLISAEAFARIINLVLQVVLARYLLADGVGVLAFVTNYGILFSIIAEMGITRVAIREISAGRREEAGKILGYVSTLRLVLGVSMLAVLWLSLLTPLGGDARSNGLVFLFSWSLLFQAVRRNSDVIFYSFEKMKYVAMFQVMNRLIAASLILICIWQKQGIAAIIMSYVVADMVDAGVAAWFVRTKIQRPHYAWNWSESRVLLLAGLPFALQMFAGQIYYFLDVVLLKFWYPDKTAINAIIGNYSRAYQVVLTLLFIPLSLCNAIFPALARAHNENDHQRARSLFGYSYGLMLLTGFPLGATFFLFRTEFMTMVFGEEFRPGAAMLAVVVWTLPLVFLTMPLGNLFAATHRQGYVTAVSLANVAFNVTLNWFVIPRHGGMGAAFATTATELFCLLLMLGLSIKFYRGLFALRLFLPIAAFQVAAVLVVVMAADAGWIVRATVAIVYGALAMAWAWFLWDRRRREAA